MLSGLFRPVGLLCTQRNPTCDFETMPGPVFRIMCLLYQPTRLGVVLCTVFANTGKMQKLSVLKYNYPKRENYRKLIVLGSVSSAKMSKKWYESVPEVEATWTRSAVAVTPSLS